MTPFLVAGIAFALDSGALAGPSGPWTTTQPQRYAMQAEDGLPLLMWMDTGFNRQARMVSFDLRLVTTCVASPGPAPCESCGRGPNPNVEVLCTLDDVAFSASGMTQEEGMLQPIVEAVDERLTGAVVQLQMRRDGRLANIDLEGLDRRNQTVGSFNENLREIVTRAFGGLDQGPPPESDKTWVQYESWLLRLPLAEGSTGGSEIVHRIVGESDSTYTIESGGRSLIVTADSLNKYDSRIYGTSVIDRSTSKILEREWTVVGAPTASSLIAQGTAGYAYLQEGWVRAIGRGDVWEVGDSLEMPPGSAPTTLQQSHTLGTGPPR
jgi:hypothetical protein